jgi:hypothetical protein
LFVAFWLLRFLKVGQIKFLDDVVIFEYISILLLALYYYFEQIIEVNSGILYFEQRFWIVSAYLVYVAGTFFLLLYLPSSSHEDSQTYYLINYPFVIIRTLLLTVAMFMENNNLISPDKVGLNK